MVMVRVRFKIRVRFRVRVRVKNMFRVGIVFRVIVQSFYKQNGRVRTEMF